MLKIGRYFSITLDMYKVHSINLVNFTKGVGYRNHNQQQWILSCLRILSAWPSLLITVPGIFYLPESQCASTSWTVFLTHACEDKLKHAFLYVLHILLLISHGFVGYLTPKIFLTEEQERQYLTHSWRGGVIHTFPKSISLKVNLILWLGFELIHYDVIVQYVSNYAVGTACSAVFKNCNQKFLNSKV